MKFPYFSLPWNVLHFPFFFPNKLEKGLYYLQFLFHLFVKGVLKVYEQKFLI